MIVQCPNCATRFRLDESRLGSRGARVTCSVCTHAFVVRPEDKADEVELDLDGSITAGPHETTRPMVVTAPPGGVTSAGAHGFSASGVAFVPTPGRDDARARPPASTPPPAPRQSGAVPFGVHEQQTAVYQTALRATGAPGALRPGPFDEVSTASSPPREASVAPEPFEMEVEDGEIISVDEHDVEVVENTDVSIDLAAMPSDLPPVFDGATDPFGEPDAAPAPPLTPAPRTGPTQEYAHPPELDSALMFSGGLSADGTFHAPEETPAPPPHTTAAPPPFEHDDAGEASGGAQAASVSLAEAAFTEHTVSGAPALPPMEGGASGPALRFVGTLVLALGFTALGVFAMWRTGQLDPAWVALLKGSDLSTAEILDDRAGAADVFPVALRSVLYPTDNGVRVLVFTGEVRSFAATPSPPLDVVAELADASGEVVASQRAPLGVTLGVSDLAKIDGAETLAAAFAGKPGLASVAPGERAAFMVVLWAPPPTVERLVHRVRVALRGAVAESAAPGATTGASASTTPAATAGNAPAETTAAAPAAGDSPASVDEERKAKLKTKKAWKAKRKEDEDAAGETPAATPDG